MKIYRFERADGTQDCDFSVPSGARVLAEHRADTEVRLTKLILSSEGRMKALAERARAEMFPEPNVSNLPRTFFGRLRWLFTGR